MPEQFKLFSCCIPVKGFLRAIIYDVQRNHYLFVPNEFCDLLENSSNILVPTQDSNGLAENIVTYLLQNEFGFQCTDEEVKLFPQMNLEYESFYDFDSIIFDLNANYINALKNFTDKNERLLVNVIQIRLFFEPTISQLNEIVKTFSKLNFCSIELVMPFTLQISQSELEQLTRNFIKITTMSIFSSPFLKSLAYNQCSINFLQENVTNEQDCGKIDESLFCCNLQNFCESQNFNTCLNNKVSIDINGNIKNCPSCTQSFGNVEKVSIKEAMKHDDFKKLWEISKDRIDICKDCEFRHMCTDCRVYIKDPNNIYSQPTKCTYNPHIAKWKDEEGYVPVEECGSYLKETGFVINKEKVEALNLELWNS